MKKMLVVYYSWSNGNTERIAKKIREVTGADMMRLEMVHPYSGSYEEVVEQGKEEVSSNFRPEIKPLPVTLENYEIVAVGTPTWWYTMAPPMASFLDSQVWRGKKVVPFMTHGGWPGHVIADIKEACSGAEFAQEMEIRFDSTGGSHMETAEADVDAWIRGMQQALSD